jgi:putative DNA modification/repair radical SAM protein
MNITEKIKILGEAGKYDACASSGSTRKVSMNKNNVGNVVGPGICHSFTPDGRCVSLFKTLMTNNCKMDCKYCTNSSTSKCHKKIAKFSPDELAKTVMHLYTGNYIEGLFLSSGISQNADQSTQEMIDSVNLLRSKYHFQGYVHLKILPGVNRDLIKQSALVADRLSVNLEAPSSSRLSMISDCKDYKIDILRRQSWIKRSKVAAGQTTQFVVGGADESDLEILKMSNWEYDNMDLNRAYYSSFIPVSNTFMANKSQGPLQREHRLYNVDFMLRKYESIKLNEFKAVVDDIGNLPDGDPKIHLAKQYFDRPIDVNEATTEELIRIPGVGPTSLQRIQDLQRKGVKLTKRQELQNIGVVTKRAMPFLRINGWHQRTLEAF